MCILRGKNKGRKRGQKRKGRKTGGGGCYHFNIWKILNQHIPTNTKGSGAWFPLNPLFVQGVDAGVCCAPLRLHFPTAAWFPPVRSFSQIPCPFSVKLLSLPPARGSKISLETFAVSLPLSPAIAKVQTHDLTSRTRPTFPRLWLLNLIKHWRERQSSCTPAKRVEIERPASSQATCLLPGRVCWLLQHLTNWVKYLSVLVARIYVFTCNQSVLVDTQYLQGKT